MSSRGLIFDIQRFCIHDGPGIRTTVFMKGCPLNCQWCHNPESKAPCPELFYQGMFCIGCGACAAICPNGAHEFVAGEHVFHRELCSACGKCADVCPAKAIRLTGESVDPEEVVKRVMPDVAFYKETKGGVTFSGGEPLMQAGFLLETAVLLKQNSISVALETSGFTTRELLGRIAPWIDLFLFDWKVSDLEKHKEFTGVANDGIRTNLAYLDALNANVILRCPLIPDINMDESHLEGIAEIANSLHCIQAIEVEPYHPLGSTKAAAIGKTYLLSETRQPEKGEIENWVERLSEKAAIPVRRS